MTRAERRANKGTLQAADMEPALTDEHRNPPKPQLLVQQALLGSIGQVYGGCKGATRNPRKDAGPKRLKSTTVEYRAAEAPEIRVLIRTDPLETAPVRGQEQIDRGQNPSPSVKRPAG